MSGEKAISEAESYIPQDKRANWLRQERSALTKGGLLLHIPKTQGNAMRAKTTWIKEIGCVPLLFINAIVDVSRQTAKVQRWQVIPLCSSRFSDNNQSVRLEQKTLCSKTRRTVKAWALTVRRILIISLSLSFLCVLQHPDTRSWFVDLIDYIRHPLIM